MPSPSRKLIFTPNDEDDLKRVAELSGRKQEVLDIVPRLVELILMSPDFQWR